MTNPKLGALNRDGFAPDVLAAAVYFVESNTAFDAALDGSLEFAGPDNYCPVLVGSIGGAKWGVGSISHRMLGHCDILPRARSVAQNLASGWK